MNTFFTSDLHLGHKNVLNYEPVRLEGVYNKNTFGFDTFEALKLAYLGACNLAQKDRDSTEWRDARAFVYEVLNVHDELLIENWNNVVSDNDTVWFLGDLALNAKAARKAASLRGNKFMILGNHDNLPKEAYKELGFTVVSKWPILLQNKFLLTHYPIDNLFEDKNIFQVYGHVHGSKYYKTWTDNSCCVCLERHNLKPIKLFE